MNEQEFEALYGHPPEQDQLHRVNCDQAGRISHSQCGICEEHQRPRFMCGCILILEGAESIIRDLRAFKERVMRPTSPAMSLQEVEEAELKWSFNGRLPADTIDQLLHVARELAELRK